MTSPDQSLNVCAAPNTLTFLSAAQSIPWFCWPHTLVGHVAAEEVLWGPGSTRHKSVLVLVLWAGVFLGESCAQQELLTGGDVLQACL